MLWFCVCESLSLFLWVHMFTFDFCFRHDVYVFTPSLKGRHDFTQVITNMEYRILGIFIKEYFFLLPIWQWPKALHRCVVTWWVEISWSFANSKYSSILLKHPQNVFTLIGVSVTMYAMILCVWINVSVGQAIHIE